MKRAAAWAVTALGLALAFALIVFLLAGQGLIAGAVFLGLLCGAIGLTIAESVLLAGASTVAGGLWGTLLLSEAHVGRVFALLERQALTAMPANWVEGWFAAMIGQGVFALAPSWPVAIALAFSAALAAGVAALVSWSSTRVPQRTVALVAGWCAVGVAFLVLVLTTQAYAPPMDIDLQPGEYAFDGTIYRVTAHEVARGVPYYEALVRAAAGDARIMAEGGVVDGRFVSWARSSAQIRMPYIFMLWSAAARLAGSSWGIVWLAMVATAVTMSFGFGIAFRRLGPLAALSSAAVVSVTAPLLWAPLVFLPELWAGLCAALAAVLWLRGWRIAAVAVAFLAALCRDVALVQLLVFAVAIGVDLFRPTEGAVRSDERSAAKRHHLRDLAICAIAIAVFFGLYAVHDRASRAVISQSESSAGTVQRMLSDSAGRSLAEKAVKPSGFGQVHLLLLGIPGVALLLVQPFGWWFGMRARWGDAVATSGLALAWIAVILTVGATSPQWGAMYIPASALGAALLLAIPSRYLRPRPAAV